MEQKNGAFSEKNWREKYKKMREKSKIAKYFLKMVQKNRERIYENLFNRQKIFIMGRNIFKTADKTSTRHNIDPTKGQPPT
jgi:hypothetical protein